MYEFRRSKKFYRIQVECKGLQKNLLVLYLNHKLIQGECY